MKHHETLIWHEPGKLSNNSAPESLVDSPERPERMLKSLAEFTFHLLVYLVAGRYQRTDQLPKHTLLHVDIETLSRAS